MGNKNHDPKTGKFSSGGGSKMAAAMARAKRPGAAALNPNNPANLQAAKAMMGAPKVNIRANVERHRAQVARDAKLGIKHGPSKHWSKMSPKELGEARAKADAFVSKAVSGMKGLKLFK